MSDITATLKDRIVGVAHVGFIVPDLDVALAGFCQIYGLELTAVDVQPPAGEEALTRFAFFQIGGLSFELIELGQVLWSVLVEFEKACGIFIYIGIPEVVQLVA